MFPLEAFQQTLTKLTSIFEDCGIAFHLTGGVTSIAYGEPRMTQDVDIVIDNSAATNSIEKLLPRFSEAEFLFDESAAREAITNRRMFQLLDMVESLKVDLYPRELIDGELTRSELKQVFPGIELPIASLVDAVLSKLIWISKGSHKNRRDVRQMVSRASAEQCETIEQWATDMHQLELLQQVLEESDEIE